MPGGATLLEDPLDTILRWTNQNSARSLPSSPSEHNMTRFSDTLMEHFLSPVNRRAMESADVVGKGNLDGYPPLVTLYLCIDGGRTVDATFEAEGCGVTIACGSMLTTLIRGRNVADCRQITVRELIEALGGIPSGKEYCADVVIRALQDALGKCGRAVGQKSSSGGEEQSNRAEVE
jgi:nitrogen fixation NifU-like protein